MVVRLAPFQFTVEALMKLVPVTMRVKAAPPAVALEGESEVTVGTGLSAEVILKATLEQVPPPGAGLVTEIWAVPALEMSPSLMAAFNWVALT